LDDSQDLCFEFNLLNQWGVWHLSNGLELFTTVTI
jgi:hypothetical protein